MGPLLSPQGNNTQRVSFNRVAYTLTLALTLDSLVLFQFSSNLPSSFSLYPDKHENLIFGLSPSMNDFLFEFHKTFPKRVSNTGKLKHQNPETLEN